MDTQNRPAWGWAIVAMAVALLTGCGGGGGTASSGAVKGPVTAFGSVYVAGIRFDTSAASVDHDDVGDVEDGLRKGMVVRVRGTYSGASGTAREIEYDQELEGPVAALDTVAGTLTVLGRTVSTNAQTIIKDETSSRAADEAAPALALADLAVGQMVEISGFCGAGGNVLAARIERKSSAFVANVTICELKGKVSNLTATTFQSGTLTVDFTSLGVLSDLVDGVLVEAKGTLASATGLTLAATSIQVEDDDAGAGNGQSLEIVGLVTSVTGPTTFAVDGVAVEAGGATFVNGTSGDLAVGRLVEVEGTLVAGTLQARVVEIEF